MKKLLTALPILLGLSFATAQQARPATTTQQTVKVSKTTQRANGKTATTKTTTKQTVQLKKDGTPDKRYKANKHLKKDGTVDKRYKN